MSWLARRGSFWLSALLLCALLSGCGQGNSKAAASRLYVALTTDMTVPKDITRVSLRVWRGDLPESGELLDDVELGGADGEHPLLLPASIAIPISSSGEVPVTVRVSAWQGVGTEEVLRLVADRRTHVPASGSVVLEVPLEWLCDGFGEGAMGGISAACAAGMTCIAGACEDAWVDPATLSPYDSNSSSDQAPCFDAISCFQGVQPTDSLDLARCSLEYPREVDVGINAALLLAGDAGVCNSDECWIVLNGFSRSGWTKQGDRLVFPPAVCERIATKQAEGVVLTTSCPTKTSSIGLCRYRKDGSLDAPSGGVAGPGSSSAGVGGTAPTSGGGTTSAPAGQGMMGSPRRDCASGQHACAGVCISNLSASACGTSCDACPQPANGSATCTSAGCGVRCDAGFHRCGERCISDASVASCGTSCTDCPEPDNGVAQCSGGGCGFSCTAGYHACGGACLLDSSSVGCGPTCTVCSAPEHGSPLCDGTGCSFTCEVGYHECGDSCVANDSTDSCGSACTPCAAPANARATCDGANCGFECDAGYRLCDGNCARPSAEVCDGIDNNCDGSVDEGLSRTCSSACGSGTEFCSAANWQGCTAPAVPAETCDGVDNNCDGAVDEGCAASTLLSLDFSTLSQLHGECTSNEAYSDKCFAAARRYCSNTFGDFAAIGFGVLDATESGGAIGCINANAATNYDSSFDELAQYAPDCTETLVPSAACNAAINGFCSEHGYLTGIGPLEHYQGEAFVGCLRRGWLGNVDMDTLSGLNPGCTAAGQVVTDACASATNAYCRAQGYELGFGTIPGADGSISVACVPAL